MRTIDKKWKDWRDAVTEDKGAGWGRMKVAVNEVAREVCGMKLVGQMARVTD